MNLLDGEVISKEGKAVFQHGQMEISVPDTYANLGSGKVTLGIRPEHVVVSTADGQIPETIDLVEPMGKDTLLYFEAEGERPFVVIVEGLILDDYKSGQQVQLTFPDDKVYFFDEAGQRIR